ncbi:MAG: glycosyltransferase family 2 protein [Bacteroidota bacterium]
MSNPEVSIVIPLYNEEDVFHTLISRLQELKKTLSFSAEFVLIDDGSSDGTARLMSDLALSDKSFHCIFLSRNYGHQLAVSAGLQHARGTEAVMIMDGDLQDPPELLISFRNKLLEGYDVIYAVRKNRKESFAKRLVYKMYYRLQRSVSNFNIPIDSGDFSMLSRRVVDHLNTMPEQSRYLRGMRSWVGFKQLGFEYDRDVRAAGNSNYSIKKLLELGFNGIFNFSEFPVRFITRLGLISIVTALIYLAYTLFKSIMFGGVPAGFTALIFAITLFSGVQLISLGLIGEYVLRIYNQVRNRPLYIVAKRIVDKDEVNG